MFEKRKRRKLAQQRLNEAIAHEYSRRGVKPNGPSAEAMQQAMYEAGYGRVGDRAYFNLMMEVLAGAEEGLSAIDRYFISGRRNAAAARLVALERLSREHRERKMDPSMARYVAFIRTADKRMGETVFLAQDEDEARWIAHLLVNQDEGEILRLVCPVEDSPIPLLSEGDPSARKALRDDR